MKNIFLLLIAFLTLNGLFADPTPLNLNVYSMTWSAKFYLRSVEQKTFFFVIPISFQTQMQVFTANKTMSFHFKGNGAGADFKSLREAIPLLQNSKWNTLINVQDDLNSLSFQIDFSKFQDFEVAEVKTSQNSIFKTEQLKLAVKNDDSKSCLYVNFDFFKKLNTNEVAEFEKFLNGLKN